MLWMVNINHLIWGYLFLAYGLPYDCPFPGATPFNGTEQVAHVWGAIFIAVSLSSILSDFMKKTLWSICFLIPQQFVVMYGAMEFTKEVVTGGDDVRVLLAAAWFVPAAIGHTIAIIHRTSRDRQYNFLKKISFFED